MLVYIEPDDSDIALYKAMVKKEGEEVCRDQLDVYTITNTIENFTFGFLYLSKKAQIGRRRLSLEDDYKIKGFIFCSYEPFQPEQLTIELVCASPNLVLGKPLMIEAENKAIEMGLTTLVLYCIDDDRLKTWYESLGFVYRKTIYLRRDVPKVHLMMKKI